MLVVITKLLLAKPAAKTSEEGAVAKGEAYMAALEDVPAWAAHAAVKRWHRGECGPGHDYAWAPDTATLRRLAIAQTGPLRERIGTLQALLDAVPLVDCSEQLRRGMAAWRGLLQAFGGRRPLRGLTFEGAVALGTESPARGSGA